MTSQRTEYWPLVVLSAILPIVACEDPQQKRLAEAQREQQIAQRAAAARALQVADCKLIEKALPHLRDLGRQDLAVDACRKLRFATCGFKVEFMYELAKRGDDQLMLDITIIAGDCRNEYEFASKHGLDAFRDHWKLLEAAEENGREAGRDEGREDAADESGGEEPESFIDY